MGAARGYSPRAKNAGDHNDQTDVERQTSGKSLSREQVKSPVKNLLNRSKADRLSLLFVIDLPGQKIKPGGVGLVCLLQTKPIQVEEDWLNTT